MSSPVFALSVHEGYACRHSGACCTAGWPIPVEVHLRPLVGAEWLLPEDGACPAYDRHVRLCRIQRAHGEMRLPESCYQFPRRALIDERGTFVTLSHFCPTAAAMLLDDHRALTIVRNPAGFPADRRYDGLDGRGQWPPLLRPDALFDHASYGRWEAHLIDVLGSSTATAGQTLTQLARTAERLRGWSADRGPLPAWVAQVLDDAPPAIELARYDRFAGLHGYALAVGSVPAVLAPPRLPDDIEELDARLVRPAWDALAPLVLRYVASKAFATWSAYDGRGVRTQIGELLLSAAVLRIECARACGEADRPLDRDRLLAGVRAADRLLMHLVDRPRLMTALATVEDDGRPHGRA